MPLPFLKSAARWIRNRRPPRVPGPPRIAGVLPTRNYRDTCSVFQALVNLSDVTIVLDDNSESPFPYRDRCTEYIAMRRAAPWNAVGNLTLLLYRAFVHNCEWIVSLDDDIILGQTFQDRAAVDMVVDRMARGRVDICHFRLRDLWDSDSHYRADGIWGQKTFPVVRHNWFFYDGVTVARPDERLHTAAFPISLKAHVEIDDRHVAYHTGCLRPSDRRARVEKYRVEDPENRFQRDYEYMLDDRNLMLAPVPEGDLAVIRRLHVSGGAPERPSHG
jgi:hypothetical protein